MVGPLTDAFAWVVVAMFGGGALLAARRPAHGKRVVVAAWVAFAGFWLALFPHFAFVKKSYVEGILALLAVPACLYTGYLLYQGRDSLVVLSRAVAIMGLVYLPFETIPSIAVAGVHLPAPRKVAIETVADQTLALMTMLGYDVSMMASRDAGYMNVIAGDKTTAGGQVIALKIVLACTGLGSTAIFAGLIGAIDAPLRRKLQALAVAVPVIYVLNLLRTTFIGIAYTQQLLQWNVDLVLLAFGSVEPTLVSWFLADRVISQVLAVVVLVALLGVVVRQLPELLTVVEDVLFIATGDDHDLAETLDVGRVRTDGGVDGSGSGAVGDDDASESGDR